MMLLLVVATRWRWWPRWCLVIVCGWPKGRTTSRHCKCISCSLSLRGFVGYVLFCCCFSLRIDRVVVVSRYIESRFGIVTKKESVIGRKKERKECIFKLKAANDSQHTTSDPPMSKVEWCQKGGVHTSVLYLVLLCVVACWCVGLLSGVKWCNRSLGERKANQQPCIKSRQVKLLFWALFLCCSFHCQICHLPPFVN